MTAPGSTNRAPSSAFFRVGRKEESPRDLIGKVFLGRFKAINFLGEGSNAHVFLAHPLDNPNEFVVVKRIKTHVLTNARFVQFFEAEVASMKRFRHPYAVGFHGAALDDVNGPCLVLEYIPGITLEQLLTRQNRLSYDRVGRLLGPLCHALQAAHNSGIMHRDLKPANLMVMNAGTPHETVRVMDFGFAGFTAKPHIQLAELTGHGPVFACGTPAYVSPEMVRGDSVDHRADLYSLGVIVFEMLTGRLPFDAHTADEVIRAHIQDPPLKFSRLGLGEIPPAIEAAVQLALCKYPNERHQSARELLDMFSRVVKFDLWEEYAPAQALEDTIEEVQLVKPEPEIPKPPSKDDQFVMSDRFEAMLPERLAAAKFRGFIEDVQGTAISSEPGQIRVHLDVPSGWQDPSAAPPSGSKILSWLSALRKPSFSSGSEPIELDLQMQKMDANRVQVTVIFRPIPPYQPRQLKGWQARCEAYYSILRKYVMAGA
jgi:eukaryotic-like serine/threonine-protein kinase